MPHVFFEGMELETPEWATYLTQESDGVIKAWDHDPLYWEMTDRYVPRTHNGRSEIVVKPEEYPTRKVRIA